ncbi:hypothetical protein QEY_0554 [Clostridioides difficile CD165]|nr:hypothetical protein QCA_1688 [Clostridioides difficile CD40]EQF34087.1 hypothetical protein QEY_0554 [Clostridioides difficile CD165]
MHLVENDLLQEVQPNIVGGRAFTQPRIMVLATEKLDVVVVLIKVEVQIAAALGTLHHAGKGAWLLGDGGALAPGSGLQRLYLFPSGPINNSLVNIEEDRPVFLRVFDPALHLVGFGVAFEVDDIAAILLRGKDFLDRGMAPLGRLQGTFGTAPACTLAAPVVGGVDDTISAESGGSFGQPVPLQRHAVDTAHHIGGHGIDHPKPGIVRVFDIAIGRWGQRNPGVAFHLIDDPALLGDVLGVVLIHYVFERGEVILALVAVHAIGHGHQPHIMKREKLLGELTHLNVVAAQPGQVFDEHRRDIPGLDCGDHFLKAGALHGGAGDTVIHEKDGVRIALVLGGFLQYLFLIADAVGLVVHIIITAQSAVKGGCAEGGFLA